MKKILLMSASLLLSTGVYAGMTKQCEKATNDAARTAYAYADGRGSYKKLKQADKKAKRMCRKG